MLNYIFYGKEIFLPGFKKGMFPDKNLDMKHQATSSFPS